MKIVLICFTEYGFRREKKLVQAFREAGHDPIAFVLGTYALQAAARDREISFFAVKEGGLSDWTGQWFSGADAMVFIGAAGIAVRAIAPYVKSKATDPAVLVTDENGAYVIPVLSGHIGGANELAAAAAKALEAQAVITTATDCRGMFSVDVFARKNGLAMDDLKTAKYISADLLSGQPVGLFSDFPTGGPIPDGLLPDTMCRHNIRITIGCRASGESPRDRMLRLVPACVAVGIGCRRGTGEETIRAVVEKVMEENRLDMKSICALSSIDIKKEEAGIRELADRLEVPFLTYTGEELGAVPGTFSESAFVYKTVGIGNVCERAAMAACLEVSEHARLLFSKRAENGVTAAAACFTPQLFGEPERKWI